MTESHLIDDTTFGGAMSRLGPLEMARGRVAKVDGVQLGLDL